MLHVLPVVVHTALISTATHLKTGLVTPQTPGHTQALLSWTFSDAIFSAGLSGASSSSLKLLAQCSCYFTTTAAHPPHHPPAPSFQLWRGNPLIRFPDVPHALQAQAWPRAQEEQEGTRSKADGGSKLLKQSRIAGLSFKGICRRTLENSVGSRWKFPPQNSCFSTWRPRFSSR